VFTNVQISVDLLFLTALLHLGGGVENPFVCYYVFHTVLASILLSRRATYVQVGLALLLFLAMVLGEAGGLLPHYHLAGYLETELYRDANYLTAVTVVIVTMLSFTAFMATTIMGRLREREAEIVTLSVSLGERASELQRAYDALRALERDKSEYMRRAAHDLRSPMSAVDLLLAVVAEGRAGEISEKSQEMLARARRKIAQVLDLASDLLTLSRAREAAFEVNLRQVNLVEILRKLEDDFRPRAESNSISLNIEAAPSSVIVMGDVGTLS
jgi:signal transduction histidine kinase